MDENQQTYLDQISEEILSLSLLLLSSPSNNESDTCHFFHHILFFNQILRYSTMWLCNVNSILVCLFGTFPLKIVIFFTGTLLVLVIDGYISFDVWLAKGLSLRRKRECVKKNSLFLMKKKISMFFIRFFLRTIIEVETIKKTNLKTLFFSLEFFRRWVQNEPYVDISIVIIIVILNDGYHRFRFNQCHWKFFFSPTSKWLKK